MQLQSLELKRTESYETPPKTLQCVVNLVGPTGKQSIVLSYAAIIQIVDVIAKEVGDIAKRNAKEAEPAMRNAADELRLGSPEAPISIEA